MDPTDQRASNEFVLERFWLGGRGPCTSRVTHAFGHDSPRSRTQSIQRTRGCIPNRCRVDHRLEVLEPGVTTLCLTLNQSQ